MSEKDIFIILVDANKERVQALAAKLKPFGYSVQVCSTLEDSLNVLKNTTAQLIIIEQSVFDNYHANYKAQLKKMNLENTALYMLKTAKTCELKKYFAKGVVGYFENSLDARTLMNGIRKSLLPQQLQWQVTLSRSPEEYLSFIADSLDELHNFKNLSFGQGGFVVKLPENLKVGDRISYSFYFTNDQQAYIIQGIGVLRWYEANTLWGGVEFESMTGNGVNLFLEWLKNKDFDEYIPSVA